MTPGLDSGLREHILKDREKEREKEKGDTVIEVPLMRPRWEETIVYYDITLLLALRH